MPLYVRAEGFFYAAGSNRSMSSETAGEESDLTCGFCESPLMKRDLRAPGTAQLEITVSRDDNSSALEYAFCSQDCYHQGKRVLSWGGTLQGPAKEVPEPIPSEG